MPPTRLSPQEFRARFDGETAVGPIEPTLEAADAADGNDFVNGVDRHLWVENPTGGAITITPNVEADCDYGAQGGAHALVITVPANQEGRLVGRFDHHRFSNQTGLVTLAYSAPGLQVAVLRL